MKVGKLLGVLSAALLAGCVLTNRLDLQPVGALRGDRAERILGDLVFELTLGALEAGEIGDDTQNPVAARVWALRILTLAFMDLDEGEYYTRASLRDCQTFLRFNGLLLLRDLIQERRSCPESDDCTLADGDWEEILTIGAPLLGSNCRLEPGGRTVQFDVIRL